ncbi:unnamed protein product, partial [Closterium sp. NIES-54]
RRQSRHSPPSGAPSHLCSTSRATTTPKHLPSGQGEQQQHKLPHGRARGSGEPEGEGGGRCKGEESRVETPIVSDAGHAAIPLPPLPAPVFSLSSRTCFPFPACFSPHHHPPASPLSRPHTPKRQLLRHSSSQCTNTTLHRSTLPHTPHSLCPSPLPLLPPLPCLSCCLRLPPQFTPLTTRIACTQRQHRGEGGKGRGGSRESQEAQPKKLTSFQPLLILLLLLLLLLLFLL